MSPGALAVNVVAAPALRSEDRRSARGNRLSAQPIVSDLPFLYGPQVALVFRPPSRACHSLRQRASGPLLSLLIYFRMHPTAVWCDVRNLRAHQPALVTNFSSRVSAALSFLRTRTTLRSNTRFFFFTARVSSFSCGPFLASRRPRISNLQAAVPAGDSANPVALRRCMEAPVRAHRVQRRGS